MNNLKKASLGLLFLGLGMTAQAQNAEPNETVTWDKYSVATNRFWSNWFVTVGGDYMASYTSQERGLDLSGNPFADFRRSWNGHFTLGKWFTPVVAVRLKTQMGKLQCVDGLDNPDYGMLNVNVQGMMNLRNLFAGYRPGRIWDISLYAGAGFYRNLDEKNLSYMYTGGILNTFHVSKRLFINLDIYGNLALNDLDNGNMTVGGPCNFITFRDRQLGISLGLGVKLGKTGWNGAPDVEKITAGHQAQIDALNERLAEQQKENGELKKQLDENKAAVAQNANAKQEDKAEKVVMAPASVSVFFNINTARMASERDLVNVAELVKQVKATNGIMEVYGYADSSTGSAEFNMKVSRQRAEAMAAELKKMGLKDEQIVIKPMGGVDELTPAYFNRRVVLKAVNR